MGVPDKPPVLSFGVVSDVQYAPISDARSYHGVPRYYRNALVGLGRAVDSWNSDGASGSSRPPLAFVLNLGDVIDGFCPKEHSEVVLDRVMHEFERLPCPTYSLLGNHECVNLPRDKLNRRLKLGVPGAPEGHSYYSVSPHPTLRVVMLDGFDVSLLGWPEGHPRHTQAAQILHAHNPNEVKTDSTGLVGDMCRFVSFGGGVSEAQLVWLAHELEEAAAADQRVVACCHIPFHPGSGPGACLIWNYPEVLSVLRAAGPGRVVATLAGHTHQNGYALDEAGWIHHVVLPSVLETPPGRDAYGRMHLWADGHLQLEGVDCMASLGL